MFPFFPLLVGIAASSASPVLPGVPAIGGRIVGGRDGNIEEVPWQVSMQVNGNHNCGGSIINDYWIVSAAHCFFGDISLHSARVGSSLRNSGGIVHAIKFYINHPLYNTAAQQSHDVSLIKVIEPFEFSAQVQPISLPVQSQKVAVGSLSTISGWGLLSWMGASPTILQIAKVPIISWEQCRSTYGSLYITEDMLCAGFTEGGVDACSNDSGGPLVVDDVLHGIVSWGNDCALPGFPGVYADVAYVRDWIAQTSGI